MRSTIIGLCLTVLAMSGGCTSSQRWMPETRTLLLYGPTSITVDEGYHFTEYTRVQVRGKIVGNSHEPRDWFATHVFTCNNSLLLVQRLHKTRRWSAFRPLMGKKTVKWEKEWRAHRYYLEANSADAEFSAYLKYMEKSERVNVEILDRLESDYILSRVITITPVTSPDDTVKALPPFHDLYTQEVVHSEEKIWKPE